MRIKLIYHIKPQLHRRKLKLCSSRLYSDKYLLTCNIQIIDFHNQKVLEKKLIMYVASLKKGVFMKNFIKITCLLASTASAIQARNVFSVSHFTSTQDFTSAKPARVAMFRNDLLDQCPCPCGISGAVEVVFYGGRTTRHDGSEKLAQFFLPGGCTNCSLNVREYNSEQEEGNPRVTADGSNIKDIEARNFNIHTVDETFASRLCFEFEQKKFGIGFVYKQALWKKCDGTTGAWFEASLPIERIENRIRLREVIENDGGGPRLDEIGLDDVPPVADMTQAFKQPHWNFSRIDCRCPREKWGIADIELKVGYNTVTCPTCILSSYTGVVLPTGNRVKGIYLFEPIVGNNHHFGILFGNTIGFQIWNKCSYTIAMFVDTNTRYLFQNKQVRSFDLLYQGPWSRYLETYRNHEQAAAAFEDQSSGAGTAGINLFTRCVKVKPHLTADINTAFVFAQQGICSNWIVEIGYNLYARQAETIELDSCGASFNDIAIKSVIGRGSTNIARNIKNNFIQSDVLFTEGYQRLSPCDIDLNSAAHPATIGHIFYGSFGYKWSQTCPCFANFGGSYEFAPHEINTVANKWLLWGKFGLTF